MTWLLGVGGAVAAGPNLDLSDGALGWSMI